MKGLTNILITFAVTMVIIAIVFRVDFIRKIVIGS